MSPGIIARLHHTDQKHGIGERAVRRVTKRHFCRIAAIQVWMKIGGQILWNVTPIFETSQIYYLMGTRPIKDVLGNHLKDLLFHLVHWLSITL